MARCSALKKEKLSADDYALMISYATKLNTPGPDLAALDGVHALTDVTGFGLAGHAIEIAKGAQAQVVIDWAKVPLIGDIPVLGHLFKTTSKVNNKAELLIFVTPKILREGVSVN